LKDAHTGSMTTGTNTSNHMHNDDFALQQQLINISHA